MKKIKSLIIAILAITLMTGCFKRDTMDNINIVTTIYPIEYIINEIYGYNSNITSVYPNGTNINEYSLTDKKIKEYATNDLFIYNGLSSDKTTAAQLLNKNNNIKILDVSKGISISRDQEELWLSPLNYLMLAQNLKNDLIKLTNSTVIIQEVENNYDTLKLTISKYDAELKTIADNATNKTIIAGNDVFKFLEKYGFEVYSIEDNDLFVQSDYTNAKNSIESKKANYVFLLNDDEISENVQKMLDLGAKEIKVNTLTTRTEDEYNDNYTYKNMMDDFIEQLKTEVYN